MKVLVLITPNENDLFNFRALQPRRFFGGKKEEISIILATDSDD